MTTTEPSKPESGSGLTVVVALLVNAGIAVLKAIAGLITGSAALFAEAAHSVADTITEVLLLTALRRSSRPADRRHPFGYGKERYFWSLMAAISIFASGSVLAIAEGIRSLSGEQEQTRPEVAYLVLGLAFVLESVSWLRAVRQIRREAAEEQTPFFHYLRSVDDPTAKTVLLEDSGALIGLLLAFLGVGLHQLTGSGVWDAAASLAIGVLLAVVAYVLGRSNRALLIGQQANRRLIDRIRRRLRERPEVEVVVDLLTMSTGADRVLLCARLDFDDTLTVGELERACVRIDAELREEFVELDEIFLEPVPRSDPELRARVLARYGRMP
ncbi:cation diffusion facilitator family transporter [Actinoalloteichus hymeniacidonis]|uniref:Cation diffusion facilitator family transporter n=1 Tax=Actinoalloteichus hymeniacidonis TaxID=340345 RepID=A0AAC9N166_9PSEU|nr:cation diffusion facilitator family transporter [Actinoalloteichus hymeniacidonis]AOS66090.1 cation diffusion facilitator family transporter [Actinoalloteichus hymeniacidonis]MBB5905806.1 cation diffusion facilitator family transporter [Actinoalloteichus hymeniacidonis]